MHRLIQQLSGPLPALAKNGEDCQIHKNVDKVEVNLSGARNKAVCHTLALKTALYPKWAASVGAYCFRSKVQNG